jgi:hypothetical protein
MVDLHFHDKIALITRRGAEIGLASTPSVEPLAQPGSHGR